MIKNSPLFIQKIMTLVGFSLFFSILSEVYGSAGTNLSYQTIITVILGSMVIYFFFIYFFFKRKNWARVIFAILFVFGFLAEVYYFLTENYTLAQGLISVTYTTLDIYIMILLFGDQANHFFKNDEIQNELDGSYKTWFSTISSILFVVMLGVKFIGKYELNHASTFMEQTKESQPADEAIVEAAELDASVQADESEVDEQETTANSGFERLDCKDPKVIAEFTNTMNNSPSALSNNIKIVDVDLDYIEEISFTDQPYELQCSVTFTLNDASEVNYLMRIYDKNGKGKIMIEGTPTEVTGE